MQQGGHDTLQTDTVLILTQMLIQNIGKFTIQ